MQSVAHAPVCVVTLRDSSVKRMRWQLCLISSGVCVVCAVCARACVCAWRLQTPREVMGFLRILLPRCAAELDSLYIKELLLTLVDTDAANKAKVRTVCVRVCVRVCGLQV